VGPCAEEGHDHAGWDDGTPGCPQWIYAVIELPAGLDPRTIEPSTVRLAGAVAPDPGYDRIEDLDGDGVVERTLRFRLAPVAPHLQLGTNVLSVTGRATTGDVHGTGRLVVRDLDVDFFFTPRTFNRRSSGQQVQGRLTFRDGVPASAVDLSSLRLNGTVPVARVVSSHDQRLTLKFDRAAVAGILPAGKEVAVWVSGTIDGVPFVARDVVRVVE
jgi:hypothetical protein